MLRRLVLLLVLLFAVAGTAEAGFPVKMKVKCAVGGERFSYTTTGSYSTWGARPDGKPYGSWTFPMELPVCPKNGLVMFRDFTPDELHRLPEILARPEFAALRDAESPYYRAAWLAGALDPQGVDRPWLLLSATWESDREPSRKARYQAEFIAAAAAAPVRPGELEWFALQVRAINARRELGRFDEALAAIEALPREAVASQADPADVDADDPHGPEAQRLGWRKELDRQETLILRRDDASEPLDAIPVEVAASYCLGVPDELPPRDDPRCGQPEIAAKMAEFRKHRSRD